MSEFTQATEPQADNVITVQHGEKTYILVGTAHVSQESVEEVKQLITSNNPEKVCIELDQGRYQSLSQPESWKNLDIYKVIKEGRGPLLLSNLMLSSYQKRLGIDMGTKPGEEMRAAIELANELNIPFTLIDRDIQTTLRRAWGISGLWGKSKLMATLLSATFTDEKIEASQIEELKKTSALHGMMEELASFLPSVKKVLIDERDQFMAARLYETSGNKLLAVVGAGHVPGMIKHLEALHQGTESSDTSAITHVPKPGIIGKVIGWLIPLTIVAFIIASFVTGGAEKGLGNILQWVAFNGGLAALGTLLALGHPLTILTAFVGAPIATLNPVLGIGMFTALVEAVVRKPRVHDLENLANDISSFRGVYKNRVTRVLLVFVLSSLGGVIGNFIALPLIFPK